MFSNLSGAKIIVMKGIIAAIPKISANVTVRIKKMIITIL
jgi:hypothetical protein